MAMMQPTIVLLKEGTDTSQGVPQLVSNINACRAVTDMLKTTLGPRGMDKLVQRGGEVTISNDGATLLKLLDVAHPAARTLVEVAQAQDAEVGDGTTSVCLLAGELLHRAKPLVEDGVHPQLIVKGFRRAAAVAAEQLAELAQPVQSGDSERERRDMLERCAATSLNSKLVCAQRGFFAPLVVDAILALDPEQLDLDLVGMLKVPGGSVTDSSLVRGVAFAKTFSYAGFEQQPKCFDDNPRIVVLNVELELKSEKENAEVRLTDPAAYQSIVDAEWRIIYDKLDAIAESGARVVLSRLPIGDLATQYFADRDIFCAGRVPADDLRRVCQATGARLQTSLSDLSSALGSCERFEERQVGGMRINLMTGCPQAHTATLVLRGGAQQFIAETERSLHDALCVVKRTIQQQRVVGGGGAIEMELSRHLRHFALSLHDHSQAAVLAFAQALEVIPRQLAQNAGLDSTDIVSALRAAHARGSRWEGVDIDGEGIHDSMLAHVWEPVMVKQNAIEAATEAACVVLSVDETVRNPKSEGLPDQGAPARPG